MTINTDTILNQTMLNSLSVKTKEASSTTEFESELQRQLMDNLKSQNIEKEVQSDAAVEEFKRELSSIGALGFLQSFNLEKIEEIKDLGVLFDSKLKFNAHINEKVNKAFSVLGVINRNFKFMESNTFIMLYE